MTIYSLDDDHQFEQFTLWGVTFTLGALSPSVLAKAKEMIKGIDQKHLKDGWLWVAWYLLPFCNDTTEYDASKVTDVELTQFAILAWGIVWG